jgi:hypothetical protein
MHVSVEESFESDPIFESRAEPSSFVTRAGGGITYLGGGRRGTFSLGVTGGGVFYHDLPGFNSYFYGLTLVASRRLSTRTTLNVAESLTNDYARRSTLLVGGGHVLPLVRALTSRTDVGLSHTLTPRTQLDLSFGYDYVHFLSGGLFDGRQLNAGVGLNRRLTPRSTLGLSYGYSRSTKTAQVAQDYHTGRVVWSTGLGRNANFTAGVGATALRRLDRSWALTPTGNASMSLAEPRSRLVMAVRYGHEVNQAFGLGVERVADNVAFSLSRPLGRKAAANVGYTYSLSRDTGEAATNFSFDTHAANAGLRLSLTRTFDVDLGYTFFNSGYYTPAVQNHVVQLGLALRHGPR